MPRPLASLSLDLDNKWSYLKTHGDAGWDQFPSYLDRVVPRILEFLARRGLRITVFVVGRDAASEENIAAIRSIARAGHEIGNHSFHHEPWLHLYPPDRLEEELSRTERELIRVTGQRPLGFRGPGFSSSESLCRLLARRGYAYDASSLPTFLGPLARQYYFLTSRLDRQEKEQRKLLFGGLRDGFRPLRPHLLRMGEDQLLEIPVTTLPILKTPAHFSYLLYLARFSPPLASCYFRWLLRLCAAFRIEPSLLLHPLDFLDSGDEPALSFFPAMGMKGDDKMELLGRWIDDLSRHHQVVTLRDHASAAMSRQSP